MPTTLTDRAVIRLVTPVPRTTWAVALSAAALTGAIATIHLYDVPLAVVVLLLVLVAVAGLLAASRAPLPAAPVLPAVSALLLVLATAAALPSDVLTSVVLAVATVAAALLMLRTDLTGDAATLRRQVTEIAAVVPALRDDFTVEPLFVRDGIGEPLRWTGALPARLELRLARARPDATLHALVSGGARP